MTRDEYARYVGGRAKSSPSIKNVTLAFVTGGAICALGQLVSGLWQSSGLDRDGAAAATSVTMIFLGALLTGLGIYDNLAKFAGAGTAVPITGFANAVASPAMEFRSEGLVTGTAVKMFTIAGPVIVYGIVASAVYGAALALLGWS